MAMRYADETTVLAELSLSDENPDDSAAITRVRSLELGLCETFDEKIGRSFGTAPVAETRTVAIGEPWGFPSFGGMPLTDYRNTFRSPRLILSTPLRSLTSIETGGTWNGTAWVDSETMATSAFLLTNKARDGYYGIDLLNGTWAGLVRITGIWGDQPTADVPVDVREAMHFIVTETYRQQQASPADEIGPDNMVVRPRNPWRYEQVVQAVNRHRIVQVLV